MDSWKPPLDEATMRFMAERLVEDREKHMTMAQDVKKFDPSASESFLVRAEECARIIQNIRKVMGIKDDRPTTDPPPRNPPGKNWPY